ncbi:tagaturonate reductase [Desulfotomaculum nigrificans]|uniref:tagaturonate reductase n=1 Tax=Desulfotomaculum nigrificans TaxID=1565 RepID=UPI0001FAEC90|nr:tagaturonate reductase [Desulfotomaculum nigrificans]
MKLTQELLSADFKFPEDLEVPQYGEAPERILQFGEGNFMRAFVDWMVHQLNQQGFFHGRVVVVQPIPHGLVSLINEQDGLYTLFLRGIQEGKVVEKKQVISSLSRGLNPYEDWQGFLACAENPDMRFIFSNTTEAGISYLKEDFVEGQPLISYPGKLAAFLYHRYKRFQGDPARGMLIFPCELIDRNGDNLKKIVLQLAREWKLPQDFVDWVENHNFFFNTLVDRIVTGYPRAEIQEINEYLGYEDNLVDAGEIFHLWVIEGDKRFSEELPFHKIGLNVLWVDDVTPYRDRKVHILNGAHTMTVPVAYLYGLDTVKEAVEDPVIGEFMYRGIFEEVIPTLKLPEEEKVKFANDVLERFRNPFIRHYLIDIALNSTSKFKTRCLPTLLAYVKLKNSLPKMLSFSLAALMAFYRGNRIEDNTLLAIRQKGDYKVKDNKEALEFFVETWSTFDSTDGEFLKEVVQKVLGNSLMWGMDLNNIPELTDKVTVYLQDIINLGMTEAVQKILDMR